MPQSLGDFEQRILFALIRLGQDAYGVTIREAIEPERSPGVSRRVVHGTHRLEKRGLVASRLGDPTPQRGGKRKRLYTLQPAGQRALAHAYETLRQMANGVGPAGCERSRH